MKTINLRATTIRGSVSLTTDATNIAELKSAIRTNGLDIPTHNVSFVDYDTDAAYSLDSAILPDKSSITFMVVTEKSNQGR